MVKDKTLKAIIPFLFAVLTGCSLPIVSPSQQLLPIAPPILKADIKPDQRRLFNDFLAKVKVLLADAYAYKPLPKVFISYAWEDEYLPEGKAQNKALQERLMVLQEDLESLGIETFIDMKYMHGNMRQTMRQHLDAADFVIVIGTPGLKKKALQDRLSTLAYFDPRVVPKLGNHIMLIELRNTYVVYYLEEGELKDIITMPLKDSKKLSSLSWIDKPNAVKEAILSQKTNEVLEFIFAKLKHRPVKTVSNVQFELGMALDKAQYYPKTLIPLIVKGEYKESFPKVMQNNLIREFRDNDGYYSQISNLSNPLGILPAICPELMRNRDYANALNDFKLAIKNN